MCSIARIVSLNDAINVTHMQRSLASLNPNDYWRAGADLQPLFMYREDHPRPHAPDAILADMCRNAVGDPLRSDGADKTPRRCL